MGACVSRSRGATEFNHKDFKKALSNIDKKATKIVRLQPLHQNQIIIIGVKRKENDKKNEGAVLSSHILPQARRRTT